MQFSLDASKIVDICLTNATVFDCFFLRGIKFPFLCYHQNGIIMLLLLLLRLLLLLLLLSLMMMSLKIRTLSILYKMIAFLFHSEQNTIDNVRWWRNDEYCRFGFVYILQFFKKKKEINNNAIKWQNLMKSQVACYDFLSFFVAAKFVFFSCWLCLFQMTWGNKHDVNAINLASSRAKFQHFATTVQAILNAFAAHDTHSIRILCWYTIQIFTLSFYLSVALYRRTSIERNNRKRLSLFWILCWYGGPFFPAFLHSQYVSSCICIMQTLHPYNNNSSSRSSSNDKLSPIHWCKIHAIFVSTAMYMLDCVHVYSYVWMQCSNIRFHQSTHSVYDCSRFSFCTHTMNSMS